MQPGDTITPDSAKDQSEDTVVELKIPRDTSPVTPEIVPPMPLVEANAPSGPPSSTEPETSADPTVPVNDDAAAQHPSWQYSQDALASELTSDLGPITWSASEFVDHQKASSWFMGLAALTGVVVIIIYLITHELLASIAIISAAGLFGVTAKRKPRTVQYQLNQTGVGIGEKFYEYNTFKSFSILDEDHLSSVQLTPLKRFALPVSLYYPPEQEEPVITMLGNYLPHEKRRIDSVDKLMNKVRF